MTLYVIVPGPLDQRTGGYLYDARMVDGLRGMGWNVEVGELEGSFPVGDTRARTALAEALAACPDGSTVVVDGLAMGGLPDAIRRHGERLRIVSLVHHPLADETGLTPEERRRFLESEREALAPCTGVIVTSAFTAGRVQEYGVPADRIRPVPPGTEPALPATGPGPGAPPRLICVGTVTPRKGYDVLVAALSLVRDVPWSCVCAGAADRDPAYARAVMEQIDVAGLGGRIDFVDELEAEALDALYRSGSLFVLASHYEGYGMALTEALARGLPVVSTTGGAIPFTVPPDAGVLVAPGDPARLAEALRSLLADGPDRLAALAASARRRGAELPTWDESVHGFAAAVEELTG